MNNKTCYFIFFITLSIAFTACAQKSESNRVYFYFPEPLDRKIEIPVTIDDSITANMMFDSGLRGINALMIDSSFVAAHPGLKYTDTVKPFIQTHAWSYSKTSAYLHPFSNNFKIGNTKIEFDTLQVLDWSKIIGPEKGLFGIPAKDRKSVWELNFDHNYLEVHSDSSFQLPSDCYTFPMHNDIYNWIVFPVQIKFDNGDTLTINKPFLIDTGMPQDMAIVAPAPEVNIFDKKPGAAWIPYMDLYRKRYTVKATAFNSFNIDSLCIYTVSEPPYGFYAIGLNFLKRFNVFFDLRNRIVGLQPVKQYKRLVRSNVGRFHFSTDTNPAGKIIVKLVADYDKNYFKTAGLKAGDEMVKVNGIPFKDITWEQREEFYKKDTLVFEVIRNKKPLTIVIPIDKSEDQRD